MELCVVFALLSTWSIFSFALDSPDIKTITVKKGRVALLHPRELNFASSSSELCKVEVISNDPMTQRVGKMSPKVSDLTVTRIRTIFNRTLF